MINMEFKLADGTRITRINRRVAQSMFEAGEPVYLCACKMRPGTPWSPEAQLKKKSEDETFEKAENAFRFYCCTAETGMKINYFKTGETQ